MFCVVLCKMDRPGTRESATITSPPVGSGSVLDCKKGVFLPNLCLEAVSKVPECESTSKRHRCEGLRDRSWRPGEFGEGGWSWEQAVY